jgi:tellurite resistance protein
MSDVDSLHQRGKSLENAFFSADDQQLLEQLRSTLSTEHSVQEFRAATGIQDEQVLSALTKLGVSPATLVAARVLPLVAVAWADGNADATETTAVTTIAGRHIPIDSPAHGLIKRWLSDKPSEDLIAAWESYTGLILSSLPANESQSLKRELLEEVQEVAQASGGMLGVGAVSKSEKQLLQRITRVLGA